MMTAGPSAERNRPRPGSIARGQQPLTDLPERGVPGDALPFAGLALALAPQRIFQPVLVVYEIGGHRPDGAQAAVIERRFAVALDLHQHTVPHMQQYAAAAVAAAADTLENGVGGRLAVVQR